MEDMKENPLRTLIYELPEHGAEQVCQASLERLPRWRRQQAESFRFLTDRLQCAKAYLLLCQLLEEVAGEPVAAPRFVYGTYGKPHLADLPHLHFNLSHCAKAVMCTLGTEPVGCDVEEIPGEVDEDVLALCFSPEEQDLIRCSENPGVEFAKLWTRKEALLKMHGIGLADRLPSLMASPLAQQVAFQTVVCLRAGYVYTVCSRR